MASLWAWVVAFLVWLSADPQQLANEPARAAAAVAAARAAVVDQGADRVGVAAVEKDASGG